MSRPHVVQFIWRNFVDSFSRKRFRKKFVGTDTEGNRYYELTHSTRSVKRGFIASETSSETPPPEWLTWLRGLRATPPTDEEIQMRIKRVDKASNEEENSNNNDMPHVEESKTNDWSTKPQDYPRYSDYEKDKL